LPSCESLLSGMEQLETSRTSTEGKKVTGIAYDDLSLYSEWCPSIDSGIALSEAETQYSASPSDSGRNMDRQEPQDPVSNIPCRTSSPVPVGTAVENVPPITSKQTRPIPLNEEKDESSVRSGSDQRNTSTATSNSGKSAIHLAAERGQNSVLRLLLNRLPDANIRDGSGRSALHLAMENNQIETVKLLIGLGSQPTTGIASVCVDVNVQDKAGRSPLHVAVFSGNLVILDLLLQISSIRIDLYDHDGHTPLHRAIMQGSEDVVEMLVEKGGDLTLPIRS